MSKRENDYFLKPENGDDNTFTANVTANLILDERMNAKIERLVTQYIRHLWNESFYELV